MFRDEVKVSLITISNNRKELLRTVKSVLSLSERERIGGYIIVEVTEENLSSDEIDISDFRKIHIKVKRGNWSVQRNLGVEESVNDIVVFIGDSMNVSDFLIM